jgi:hypothetical protein
MKALVHAGFVTCGGLEMSTKICDVVVLATRTCYMCAAAAPDPSRMNSRQTRSVRRIEHSV